MMIFAAFALATVFSAVLWLVSAWFRPRFAGKSRVVMNWGFDLKPNSYASPRVALAVTPAIGTMVQFGMAILIAFGPSAGDDVLLALMLMPFMTLVLGAIHALHLRFALRADDSRQ